MVFFFVIDFNFPTVRLQKSQNHTHHGCLPGTCFAQNGSARCWIEVITKMFNNIIFRIIIIAVLLMGGLILSNFALNIASVWIRNILGIKAQNRMQQKLLDRMLRSKWNGKETHHSGDVLNRLETDVTNVVNFLTEIIPNSLSTLALFVGAFGYLFMMDWRLAIVIVIMIPIFILFS